MGCLYRKNRILRNKHALVHDHGSSFYSSSIHSMRVEKKKLKAEEKVSLSLRNNPSLSLSLSLSLINLIIYIQNSCVVSYRKLFFRKDRLCMRLVSLRTWIDGRAKHTG